MFLRHHEHQQQGLCVCQGHRRGRVVGEVFKDGIMNINNKDYVFVKATGEGEW